MFKVSFFGNPYALGRVMIALVAHLALLYVPFAQNLFETAPISLETWGLIVGVSVTIIIVSEIEKALLRRPTHQREAGPAEPTATLSAPGTDSQKTAQEHAESE